MILKMTIQEWDQLPPQVRRELTPWRDYASARPTFELQFDVPAEALVAAFSCEEAARCA